MNPAPIALFVFNRPAHTLKTLAALRENPEFAQSRVYVFADGPRNEHETVLVAEVRGAVAALGLDNLEWVASENNRGLANSIIAGVTHVCGEHGRVIVMEDDLLVSRHFLAYMNTALDRYAQEPRVMQVSGHCFPGNGYGQSSGSSFLPQTSSWGWATWKRAWDRFDPELSDYDQAIANPATRRLFNLDGAYPYTRMIEVLRARNEMNRSWAVRWHWSVFKHSGLGLFPHRTLVSHFGNDGSGTNLRGRQKSLDVEFSPDNGVSRYPEQVQPDLKFFAAETRTIRRQQSPASRALRLLRRWI